MMLSEKNFLLAGLTLSLTGHVLCFSIFGIDFGDSRPRQAVYTEVSFLGPILEKTAFEMMVEEYHPKAETLFRTSAILEREYYLEVAGPGREDEKSRFARDSGVSDRGHVSVRKGEGRDFLRDKGIFYHIRERGFNKFIEGPARERMIISKPAMPVFSKKFLTDNENFTTVFRFVLSHDGTVELVEPVMSSGYPDIDTECMNYIRSWKFEPRRGDSAGEKDWGNVTLHIKVN
ncbi:MAG: energy transducer TonB [Candidatus Omnitrophota bacterium]